MNFYREIGKHPIHIKKEVRGHAANRLQAALWREAIHLVTEGVVSVADADAAIAYGPGLRWALMGPHLTFHMAGGDGGMKHFMGHIGPAMQSLQGASVQLEKTLSATSGLLGTSSTGSGELPRALRDLREASRSVRLLTDYLERHPEALVQGKRP